LWCANGPLSLSLLEIEGNEREELGHTRGR